MQNKTLIINPLGHVKNGHNVKFKAGHQPESSNASYSIIQLRDKQGFEDALKDLEGFDRIWLIFWFDKNPNWRSLVLPPRGPGQRRGVFATRSPHRPNPIGLTAVELLEVDRTKLTLKIGPCDLIEDTPILDIKPYIPTYDAFPDSKAGWVDEVNEMEKNLILYEIKIEKKAEEQLNYLKEIWNIDFLNRMKEILCKDPKPHRTRRIHRSSESQEKSTILDEYVIHCGAWRVYFETNEDLHCVNIKRLGPGFSRDFITHSSNDKNKPDFDAQLGFMDHYPESEMEMRPSFINCGGSESRMR
ncbi:MAG: tRNA (N6-threonylcarbamoyladenosine(37)-N6)-methyltransferase TrmO [Candidatus Paceibacterota bacterium]